MKFVHPGKVMRFFEVSLWPRVEEYEQIVDALMDEDGATEVCSGHTGFIVGIEDDKRTDEEIVESLSGRLQGYVHLLMEV